MSSQESVFLSPDGQTRVRVTEGTNEGEARCDYYGPGGDWVGGETTRGTVESQGTWYASFGWAADPLADPPAEPGGT